MIDPADYRDRFPILETCTYLINHSLAAMPAAAEDNLREYARIWRERGIRAVGGGLVGDAGHGRRPARPDPRRAARLDRHAPERDGRRGDRPLLLHADRRAEPDRLRGGELPVGALPLPGAAGARGRRGRGRRRDRRRDRRADAARPDQPRPVQERRDPGRRADRPPRARGRRLRGARLLPVGGRRAVRPDGARRRLRRRRQRQVALRRAGRRLALRAARPRGAARADARRLAGTRAAVRVRARARVRRAGRGASSPARRTSPRSTRRPPATT